MNINTRIAFRSLIVLLFACGMLCAVPGISRHLVKKPKVKKAKNIIFLIGDGMGTAQIYAGLTSAGKLNLERFKVIGFSKTNSSNDYITDSAAGATAFSIGEKTYNGAIGVDATGAAKPTILEIAEKNGLATGLVATCSITHATPASFIAHVKSRSQDEDIAADFLKTDIDLFIGGGRKFFEKRKDNRDLTKELAANKYALKYKLEDVEASGDNKIAALLADESLPKMSEGRGDMLPRSTTAAVNMLHNNKKGFFLMVEGSQIDWGGHDNTSSYIISEMVDFDQAVGKALDFAEKDGETLVVVTADHETGGYTLVGGNFEKKEVEAKFTTTHHTAVMVPVFAYGPGAEAFAGIYHNNTIFNKFMEAYGFKKP
ncbi:MAG: alkaline phosphatase [Bacteroidota bacterium]